MYDGIYNVYDWRQREIICILSLFCSKTSHILEDILLQQIFIIIG